MYEFFSTMSNPVTDYINSFMLRNTPFDTSSSTLITCAIASLWFGMAAFFLSFLPRSFAK